MYDDILLPVDSSDGDVPAVVDQALFLADVCDATLHVFHVVDEHAYRAMPDDVRERVTETLTEDGRTAIRTVAARADDRSIDVERELRQGKPTVEILTYADESDTDLIVMGTHGRTGYERYLLGSVAEKVVRASPVPVLTTHIGDVDPEDVLAGLDEE